MARTIRLGGRACAAMGAALLVVAGCSARAIPLGGSDDGDPAPSAGEDFDDDGGVEPATSTDGGSETGGEEDDDGDGGTSFIPPHDWGWPDMCDIWGDDCPEGEKCTAYASSGSYWDANKCVPVMGDDQHGEACQAFESKVSGLDTCAKGAMCWGITNAALTGYCLAFCAGSPDDIECPEDTVCPLYGDGVLPLCQPTCDPLGPPSQCPNPDDLCVGAPAGDGFMCVANASGGIGTFGSPCQYVNSCNHGLFCANADMVPGCQGAQGCCTHYCDLGDPVCPELGLECVPWFEQDQAPPGYAHVGACVSAG